MQKRAHIRSTTVLGRAQSGLAVVSVIALLGVGSQGRAENQLPYTPHFSTAVATSGRWDSIASGGANLLFLGAGVLLPLVEDGHDGKQHSLRAVDATLTAVAFSEVIKTITREKRPDSTSRDSFPSGHATAAFAVATMQAEFHPRQAALWYLGATAIGASRVTLHRHYIHDVLAGAALGYFTARWELHRRHGILLTPYIHSPATGFTFARRF